jgi:hypothetical protein
MKKATPLSCKTCLKLITGKSLLFPYLNPPPSAGQYTYGLIDSLDYIYANDDSRLSSIEDFVADPLASQPPAHCGIAQRFFAVRIHLRRGKNP